MRADPFKRSDRRRWLAKPLVGAAAPAALKFRSRVWALVSGAVRSLLPTKGQKVAVASAESYRRRRGICALCCSGVHAAAGGSHTRATCRSRGRLHFVLTCTASTPFTFFGDTTGWQSKRALVVFPPQHMGQPCPLQLAVIAFRRCQLCMVARLLLLPVVSNAPLAPA